MADKATEMKNRKENFFDQRNAVISAEDWADDIERDEFAAEIENIFDHLRAVGSPQNYSLDEVLAMAIAAEQKLTKDGAREDGRNLSLSRTGNKLETILRQTRNILAAGLKHLHFREVMGSLLLVVMLAVIAYLSLVAVRVDSKSISDEEINSRINLR